jgi:hypothetical protein
MIEEIFQARMGNPNGPVVFISKDLPLLETYVTNRVKETEEIFFIVQVREKVVKQIP